MAILDAHWDGSLVVDLEDMHPPCGVRFVDMLADGTDIVHRYVPAVDMVDHVGFTLALLGTDFALPTAPLDFLKELAVIDSICKKWRIWSPQKQSCAG